MQSTREGMGQSLAASHNGRTPLIAPSILSADLAALGAEIASVEKAGAEWLHVDVMDGSFVPPITWGTNAVQIAKKSCSLFIDTHLMIVNPEKHIEAFRRAGSGSLTVHYEACADLGRTLNDIRDAGMLAGASINPETPVSCLFDYLEACDFVLIMTVHPGWGGQKFIDGSLERIAELAKEIRRRKPEVRIEVDGGINLQTARECFLAGADIFVAGSYIFNQPDRGEAIRDLRSSLTAPV